jgi:protein TonB
MSVGSGWISQMDVGMIETANYANHHQYRENDIGYDSRPTDQFSPAILWVVALLVSLAFHVWLIKENQFPQMSKVFPELSSSQSISIQFKTLTFEQPIVDAQPKSKVASTTVEPVKNTKPKPAPRKQVIVTVTEKKNDMAINMEKNKRPMPGAIKVIEKVRPAPEKVTRLIEATAAQIIQDMTRDHSAESTNLKKEQLVQSQKVDKSKIMTKQVETYESYPLIKSPKFLKPPTKPKYPRLAKRKKQQGTSIIRAKISKLGTVDEVRLYQTSGYRLLDKSAISALRQWQFEPAIQAGVSVTTWVQVPVKFQLEN